jgi:Xaa-Pro aminopeptidase
MTAIAQRRKRLGEALEKQQCAYLVTDAQPDIRYYTGCMDAGGFLIVDRNGMAEFLTNAHDAGQASAEAVETTIHVWQPGDRPSVIFAEIAGRLKPGKALLPVPSWSVMSALRDRELIHSFGFTSHLRRVKEPGELEIIRQAARIVETGMNAAREALRPGMREIEVAAEAERAMRAVGADGRIFESKVESGPRSAWPSTYAGQRVLEKGDLVLIDIGPTYRGYFGDLTRTFAIGEPSRERRDVLELVLRAQLIALGEVRAGAPGKTADLVARSFIKGQGKGALCLHNTGHSLGLAGDSLPLIAPDAIWALRAGEGITIEPGAYREGIGGVRIEDEVLVTEQGAELLTSLSKSLDWLVVEA